MKLRKALRLIYIFSLLPTYSSFIQERRGMQVVTSACWCLVSHAYSITQKGSWWDDVRQLYLRRASNVASRFELPSYFRCSCSGWLHLCKYVQGYQRNYTADGERIHDSLVEDSTMADGELQRMLVVKGLIYLIKLPIWHIAILYRDVKTNECLRIDQTPKCDVLPMAFEWQEGYREC